MVDEIPYLDAKIVGENDWELVLLGRVEKHLVHERHAMISLHREDRYAVDDIWFYFSEFDWHGFVMSSVEVFVFLVDIQSLVLENSVEILMESSMQ